jgi:hypothetical protein
VYSAATIAKRLAHGKMYYQTHKEESAIRCKIYREANKEQLLAYEKEYREANKEARSAYSKEYNRTHKEEIKKTTIIYRQTHKEEISAWEKEYWQTEQGRSVMKNKNYKRKSAKFGVGYESFNPIDVFKRDGYRCQICKKKTRPDYKNVNHVLYPNLDHIISLSNGGEHSMRNTRCLCHQCNIIKSNNDSKSQLRLFG